MLDLIVSFDKENIYPPTVCSRYYNKMELNHFIYEYI